MEGLISECKTIVQTLLTIKTEKSNTECTISVLHNVSCFECDWLRRWFTILLNPSCSALSSEVGLDGLHCLGTQAICSIQNICSDYKQRDCDAVRLEELGLKQDEAAMILGTRVSQR